MNSHTSRWLYDKNEITSQVRSMMKAQHAGAVVYSRGLGDVVVKYEHDDGRIEAYLIEVSDYVIGGKPGDSR